MAQRRDYPHKITFKVKHLDEYHDIVLDWDEDRYRYKSQQIFDQLELITGVPNRYACNVCVRRPDEVNLAGIIAVPHINLKAYPPGSEPNLPDYSRHYYREDDISWRIFRDGERYHLEYYAYYDYEVSKRISFSYSLVNERYVTEGACSRDFCHYKCTESHFKKLKDLASNDELNAKITPLVQPIMETFSNTRNSEKRKILIEFNVEQFLYVICSEERREVIQQNGHERQDDLYLRTRG
ncbi:uncharacterized protein LOC107365442 [Tetranychus urticae]|uniref:Uncharacterized protein n=1 Tax=Tetranychus urticae TaxID=32264 RepID=T1KN08_TETUR|nr:uncharacterized protein LOC107365442 [Tetranychus urticae]